MGAQEMRFLLKDNHHNSHTPDLIWSHVKGELLKYNGHGTEDYFYLHLGVNLT